MSFRLLLLSQMVAIHNNKYKKRVVQYSQMFHKVKKYQLNKCKRKRLKKIVRNATQPTQPVLLYLNHHSDTKNHERHCTLAHC